MAERTELPSLPRWRTLGLIVAGFFAATFLIYGHSLGNDFVRWDDGMLVYENPAIREISAKTLTHIFTTYDPELYIPLTFFTYQLDFLVGGIHPFIYHFNNLLLHTLNAILACWLAFLVSRKKSIALFVGFLFALHPLHTEAVEWVSARKDVLSSFFFLLSAVGYLYWRERGDKKTLVGSVIAFTLGLISKVMVITLPVVLLLLDWREGRKWSVKMFTEKIPYFAAAVIVGIIGIVGKTGVIQSSTLSGKILMACKSAVFYLEKIFVPVKFSLLYPYNKPITLASPDFLIPIAILLMIAGLALWSLKWTRNVAFGLAFYLVTVGPTFINFAKGGELDIYFASDRYAYIPSIGIFFVIALVLWGVAGWLVSSSWFGRSSSNQPTRNQKPIFITGASVIIVICAVLAFRQSFIWQNTETLFQNVIAYYPESSHVAHNNLGNVYRLRNDLDAAVVEYNQAIAIRPNAKTLSNLGAVYRRRGNFAEAYAQYDRALELNPVSREAHLGLGLVLMAEKKYAQAEGEFRHAAEIDPTYEEAFTNLGAALMAQGKPQDAMAAYASALQINAFFVDAHYNMAVALATLGRKNEAITEYESVTRLAPRSIPPRINLGILYHEAGEAAKARAQFEAVLEIDPQNRAAQSALQQIGN